MLNVAPYLERIGYSGSTEASPETLIALHRAHMYAVPFENLDIYLGRTIVCDERRFLHKIIGERRGGFCYELNGAFAALLRGLGFQVTMLSARVCRAEGGDSPEFAHLCLRVDFAQQSPESTSWLADVGFGDSFVEPLRVQPGLEQPQFGRVYRLMETASGFRMDVKKDDAQWNRQYVFSLEPHRISAFEAMCHYQQTSPDSHFTQQRICSLARPDGRITLSDLKLIETHDGRREERELSDEREWRKELREKCGIVLGR